jgi:hypothetical protein
MFNNKNHLQKSVLRLEFERSYWKKCRILHIAIYVSFLRSTCPICKILIKIDERGTLKITEHDKFENIAGSVWLSLLNSNYGIIRGPILSIFGFDAVYTYM